MVSVGSAGSAGSVSSQRRLQLLAEAAAGALGAVDLDAVLPRLLGLARSALEADAYAFWERGAEDGRWRLRASDGLSATYVAAAVASMSHDYPSPTEPTMASDPDAMPMFARHREAQRAEGIASLLVLPMIVRGSPRGTLVLYWRRPRHLDEDEMPVARALMGLASNLLTNVELHEEARRAQEGLARHVAQLEVLHELGQRALAAPRVEDVYAAALDALQRALRCDRASILLFDPDGVLRFKASRGLSEGYRRAVEGHTPWRPDQGDAQPITVADARADASLGQYRDVILGEGIRALAFIPLAHQSRLLGKFMVYFDAPREFAPDELRLAQSIAGHVSWAIARHASTEALRGQNERYEALIAAQGDMGDGIVLLDENRIVWANDATARILGRPLADLATLEPRALVAPEELPRLMARAERRAAARLRHDRYETRVLRPDGSVVPVEVSIQDIRESMRVVLVRNIEERVTREAELERARRELAMSEKLSAMGSLVNGVAHELRTPLASLSNTLHLIGMRIARASEEGSLPAPLVPLPGLAASAVEDIDRINRLVISLRRFAKGEPGESGSLPLEQVVERASRLFEGAYKGRLGVRQAHDPRALALLVPVDVEQVIINLLENAADASPVGASVLLETRLHEEGVELAVRDEGSGIPRDVQGRMFEPFFTTKPQGNGLGLSIVRRIAERHGGTIHVDTALGVGTRVAIRLPVRR